MLLLVSNISLYRLYSFFLILVKNFNANNESNINLTAILTL